MTAKKAKGIEMKSRGRPPKGQSAALSIPVTVGEMVSHPPDLLPAGYAELLEDLKNRVHPTKAYRV